MNWKISAEDFNSYIDNIKIIIAENEVTNAEEDFQNGKIEREALEEKRKRLEQLQNTANDPQKKKRQFNWHTKKNAFSLCLQKSVEKIPPNHNPIELSRLIYPFGFNLSQKKAVENALSCRLSVVEGPPGTGKTQSILNIIANCVINNKTVAVVSNNNSAVNNVLEKLQKHHLDFITASLGNKKRNNAFNDGNPQYPSELSEWEMEDDEFLSLKQKVSDTTAQLTEHMETNNRIAIIRQESKQLQIEYQYFVKYKESFINGQTDFVQNFMQINDKTILQDNKLLKKLREQNSEELLDFIASMMVEQNGNFYTSLLFKIRTLLKYGLIGFSLLKEPVKAGVFIKDVCYNRKIEELEAEIIKLTNKLQECSFDAMLKENTDDAMLLFKATLYKRYKSVSTAESRYLDRQSNNFKAIFLSKKESQEKTPPEYIFLKNPQSLDQDTVFLKEFPVIMSTTHSLRSILLHKTTLDMLIVDESSQVDIIRGAESMSCAYSSVLIGDMKQLPPIITDKAEKSARDILHKYNLHDSLGYIKNNSLLKSITEILPNVPRVLLREHYRCAPAIIEFCNQRFYNGELIIMSKSSNANCRHKPMEAIITNENGYDRENHRNISQVDAAISEVIAPAVYENPGVDIGVIAPYVNQVQAFKDRLEKNYPRIPAATVHSFQGRENDTIVFSSVESNIEKASFPDDDNFINVAVSRAKERLVLIAEGRKHSPASNIMSLIDYIKYNNFEIHDSKVRSVFSCLHKQINGKYREYIIKNKDKFPDSAAEDIFYEQVLRPLFSKRDEKKDYTHFGVSFHYPLSQLNLNSPEKVRDKLTEEHAIFAFFSDSHIDFLINVNENKPILAIEINGKKHNKAKRKHNDMLKKDLLNLMGIPLLTLTTYDCSEMEKVAEALDIHYFNNSVKR